MSFNNGFLDNSGSNPVHGVDRLAGPNGSTVYRSGNTHQAMVSNQGPRTTIEHLPGVMRATARSAKDDSIAQSDAALSAQYNSLPKHLAVDRTVRATAGPNPAFGDLAPRSAAGFYQQEITMDSIITLPGAGTSGRVKDLMASGLIGKTLEGKYVLNYNPKDFDPNYGQRVQEDHHQQEDYDQEEQQSQPVQSIADPVDHVTNILDSMGLNGYVTLKRMESKYGNELLKALEAVSQGDNSKIIGLLARGV